MHQILLVEDTEEIKDLIVQALGTGAHVAWAPSLAEAERHLKDHRPDLILLDVQLPDGNGFQFFSLLQNNETQKEISVIFLTQRDGVADKVLGLSLGAEDYISKPFSAAELKARVEMRLKKNAAKIDKGVILRVGPLEVNHAEQRAFDHSDGQRKDLGLTPLEIKILAALLARPEQVLTREQLLDHVWGVNMHLSDRAIDSHIYLLRKKLGPLADMVQSVYGQGYRLAA